MLQSNKINVVEFDTQTFEDVKGTIKTLGDIYGTQDKAQKENELLDKQVAAVTSKLPKEKKRIVIMHATASAVTVEGSHSIAGCVSDILGFENVAAAALKGKSNKTPYSMETLVEQNPEISSLPLWVSLRKLKTVCAPTLKITPHGTVCRL